MSRILNKLHLSNLKTKRREFNLLSIFSHYFSLMSSNSKFCSNQILKIMILDVGTSNTRVRIYDQNFNVISSGRMTTKIMSSRPEYSEIDGKILWLNVREICQNTLESAKIKANEVTFMGITTQRESFLIWNKNTREPLCNIITWQDRRSVETCKELNNTKELHLYKYLCEKASYWTGNKSTTLSSTFLFHPNMASVRLYNFLEHNNEIKEMLNLGDACFGTVESWLAYNLTDGEKFVSDYGSLSLTGFFDPFDLNYHNKLMYSLGLKEKGFPKVINTHGYLFETSDKIFGAKIPVTCLIGDQQASTFGCGCVEEGMVKATLGTGLFIDLYMGNKIIPRMADQCYPLIGWYGIGEKPHYIYETRSDFANAHIYKFLIEKDIPCAKMFDEILTSDEECQRYNVDKNSIYDLLNKTILIFYDIWQKFIANTKYYHKISDIKMDGGYSTCDYLVKGISSLCNIKVLRMKDIESTSNGTYYLSRLGAGLNNEAKQFNNEFNKFITFEPDENIRKNLLELHEKT